MNVDYVKSPGDDRSGNDRLKRSLHLWWRSLLTPEPSTAEGPRRWGIWVAVVAGLLSIPFLLNAGRDALAVDVGVIAGAAALETIAAEIVASRRGLARALHVVALVAVGGLLASWIWLNPFDWDGTWWVPLTIIIGWSLLRSVRQAWREAAPKPLELAA